MSIWCKRWPHAVVFLQTCAVVAVLTVNMWTKRRFSLFLVVKDRENPGIGAKNGGRWSRWAGGRLIQVVLNGRLSVHEKSVAKSRWSLYSLYLDTLDAGSLPTPDSPRSSRNRLFHGKTEKEVCKKDFRKKKTWTSSNICEWFSSERVRLRIRWCLRERCKREVGYRNVRQGYVYAPKGQQEHPACPTFSVGGREGMS